MSNIHTDRMHFKNLRFKDKNCWIGHNDDNTERSSDGNSQWPWNSVSNFSELCSFFNLFIIIIIINEFHRDASLTKTSGPLLYYYYKKHGTSRYATICNYINNSRVAGRMADKCCAVLYCVFHIHIHCIVRYIIRTTLSGQNARIHSNNDDINKLIKNRCRSRTAKPGVSPRASLLWRK